MTWFSSSGKLCNRILPARSCREMPGDSTDDAGDDDNVDDGAATCHSTISLKTRVMALTMTMAAHDVLAV